MKDIIWTVIILWIVWRVYDAFKSVADKRTQPSQHKNSNQNQQRSSRKEGDIKVDLNGIQNKSHFKASDGEYVDYEEVK